ncbi:unnamed protein product [Enterobius vermicularis]|uniref:G_PROTEIN_RECEP_F1_2 domain-containing protein n=1 Tax=Enterobius vermicularis TaxID=51028 RepID=A0A0N4VR17_ENTVE|nr:unnamed protein product [Enterobius vermicularis]
MITRQRLLNFLSYGAHVLFFAVTSALMLICTTFMLHSAWTYDKLYVYDTCRLVDYIETVIRVETLAGSVVLLYCCRSILDSVLLLIAEYGSLLPWILQNSAQSVNVSQKLCLFI